DKKTGYTVTITHANGTTESKDLFNGKDGQTPQVEAVKGDDGKTHYSFYVLGPDGTTHVPVGTVDTPEAPKVKADGDKYVFYLDNGTPDDPSDDTKLGEIEKPAAGKDGDTINVTPLKGDTEHPNGGYTVEIIGSDGTTKSSTPVYNGNDGKTPQLEPVTDPDTGKVTGYKFFVIGDDGQTHETVGTFDVPETPKSKLSDDKKSYIFYLDDGTPDDPSDDTTLGTVPIGDTIAVSDYKPADDSDKKTGYTVTITHADGTTETKNLFNGDAATAPIITPNKDDDGNVLSYTITYPGQEPITIYNGTKGEKGDKGDAPTLEAVTDPKTGKTTGYKFYVIDANGNKQEVGDFEAPKDGDTISVTDITPTDADSRTGYILTIKHADGSQDVKTVYNGQDGQTPVVTPVTDVSGKVTGYTFTLNGQPSGTVLNGTDGQTPQVAEVKDDDGNVTGYEFYYVNGEGERIVVGQVATPKPITIVDNTKDEDGTTTLTFSDGNKVTIKDGKDGAAGQTPQVKAVVGEDGKTNYEFYVTDKAGKETPVGTIEAPKDGKTPKIEPVTDGDGKTIGYNFYYTNDAGEEVSMGRVDAPKDGQTPTVKPHTDSEGKTDGYIFTLNGVDYTVLNGKDGANGKDADALTVTGSIINEAGDTVITFSDGSHVTVPKGQKGDNAQTPNVRAVTGEDGKTSYEFYVTDKDGKEIPVGTVDAPKDGQTPAVTPHTDSNGDVDGYVFTLNGKDYIVKNGADLTVRSTTLDTDGNTVITFSDGSQVTVAKGTDGKDGKDGQTPKVRAVTGEDGKTNYEFFVTDKDGKETTVGTVEAPKDGKDGQTPTIEAVKDGDGNITNYNFYYTNEAGDKVSMGSVEAPKDGQTPDVKPHTDSNGNVDGYVFTLNGKDYIVKNGADLTVDNSITDSEGNTVITFSDGSQVTIDKGADGKDGVDGKDGEDGQTPQVRAVTGEDGKTRYEFYVTDKDGKETTVGTVDAPQDGAAGKDGKTPQIEAVKDGDGNITSYDFYYLDDAGNKVTTGTIQAPKDGKTPEVKPHTDGNGDVDGYTFTLNGVDYTVKNGKDGVDGKDGKDGEDGKDGVNGTNGKDATPLTVTGSFIDEDGNTRIIFSDGSTVLVKKGEDGQTPQVEPVTDANGKVTDYNFFYLDEDGKKISVGIVPAPADGKDGQTPTVKPHTNLNGQVDGWTFTLNGVDYDVLNGAKGDKGDDGTAGDTGEGGTDQTGIAGDGIRALFMNAVPEPVYQINDADNPPDTTTGTPTGDPSGNPTGTTTGTPTGDPSGNPTGTTTGTPTGDPSGNPTGTTTGTPTGDPSGNPTGTTTGTPTGDPSGNPTGTTTGTPTGDPSGNPTGTTTGTPTGDPSGNPTGTTTGTPTGDPSGNPTGTTTGTPTGDPSGNPTGTTTGTPTGDPSGNPTGTTTGTPTGDPSGNSTGTTTGTPTGDSSAQTFGQQNSTTDVPGHQETRPTLPDTLGTGDDDSGQDTYRQGIATSRNGLTSRVLVANGSGSIASANGRPTLPETGNSDDAALIMIGVGVTIADALAAFSVAKKRRDSDDDPLY
ncbi:collagen-like domain-containing protein, partial [Lacticaseibacillus hegangensis]